MVSPWGASFPPRPVSTARPVVGVFYLHLAEMQ